MIARHPLSQTQHLIWIGQQLYDAPLYNMAFTFELEEDINPAVFVRAFETLVSHSDVLRSTVIVDGETPYMQVSPEVPVDFTIVDHSDKSDEQIALWSVQRAQQSFDLGKILWDTILIKKADGKYIWFLNQHHLITDGWSVGLIYQYHSKIYKQLLAGEEANIVSVSYAAAIKQESKPDDYYKEYARQIEGQAQYHNKSNGSRSTEARRIMTHIDKEQVQKLHELVKNPSLRTWTVDQSMFILFGTILSIVNSRLTRSQQSVYGTPSHGRFSKESKGSLGVFMKLLPIAVNVQEGDTFVTLYQRVRDEVNGYLRYAQGAQLTADLGNKYNSLLNYINAAVAGNDSLKAKSTWIHTGHTDPNHHLRVQVYDFDKSGDLTLSFDFIESVFDEEMCQPVVDMFVSLMDSMIENIDQPISTISELEQALISEFNQTDAPIPAEETIVSLFRRQVQSSEYEVALQFEGVQVTYGDLDERSEQFANNLLSSGVKQGDLVCICIDRSVEMLVSLIGILKCGAAYVPIDPTYPEARIDYILDHSQAKLVVTSLEYKPRFAIKNIETILPGSGIIQGSSLQLPMVKATDLMYVIYTSGSTGQPKGVMNQHDGLVNRLIWAKEYFGVEPGDVLLQKTNYCFDVSVWELFLPLISGVKLVIASPGKEGDTDYLKSICSQYRVTMLHFVPPMLEVFLLGDGLDIIGLQKVICSGERLKVNQVNTFKSKLNKTELYNLYGPTEAAIDVTAVKVLPANVPVKSVSIGRPVYNTKIAILDAGGNECGVGTQGEIYIAGIQVAKGYLHNESRTAESFITDSSRQGSYRRMYRTGDIGYWTPKGEVMYIGRKDFQVKVRGYRIELGEIEAQLDQQSEVKQSIVLVKEGESGSSQILAFIAADEGVNADGLKSKIGAFLPEYMVPHHIEILEALPVTHNGKVDRQGLLQLPLGTAPESATKQGPRDEFEQMVFDIWKAVLGKDLDIQDSFFSLGGDSISGIRVMVRVNDTFEMTLPVTTIFKFITVEAMAQHIKETMISLLEAQES